MRMIKFLVSIFLLLATSTINYGQFYWYEQLHWESLVLETDTFNYLVPASEPASDWIQPGFNDSSWASGIGGFGYDDGDDNTIIAATTSVYIRKNLNITDTTIIDQLLLDIDYDDAFVAYINGVEVARSGNLLAGTPSMSGSVTSDHEAVMYTGGRPERFILDPGVLTEGNNTLAFHIMNISLGSTDISSRIFLNAEIDSPDTIFNPTPVWFQPPLPPVSYEFSNIPIIKINTQGQAIVDEPKIMAIMQVLNDTNGTNYFSDTIYEYEGYIGIEIRGNTAQMFPKKKLYC